MQKQSNPVNQNLRRFSIKSAKGWDDAIKEAETQIRRIENRAARLRKVIADFKELKANGHPWPETSTQN